MALQLIRDPRNRQYDPTNEDQDEQQQGFAPIPGMSAAPMPPAPPAQSPPISSFIGPAQPPAQGGQPARSISGMGSPATAPSVGQVANDARTLQNSAIQPPTPQDAQRRATFDTLSNSKPGVAQIKSPWARVPLQILDAVGSAVAPRLMQFLPGTTLHHDFLTDTAANNLDEGESVASGAVKRQTEAASIPKIGGEAREANSRAANLDQQTATLAEEGKRAPKQNYVVVGDGLYNATDDTWKREPTDKTKIDYVEIPREAFGETGAPYKIPREGASAFITEKLKPAPKPGDQEGYVQQFLKDNNLPDTIGNRDKALESYKKHTVSPPQPPQSLMFEPRPDGSSVGVVAGPGTVLSPGAQSKEGINAVNTPTAASRSMSEMAATVVKQTPVILGQIDRLKDKIGPGAGRWNELWVNRAGMNDPDFAGLDQDLDLYASALVRTHFGARGGQGYREALKKDFTMAQSPEDLKSRIEHADEWIKGYASMGSREGTPGAPASVPEVKTQADYDKLPSGAKFTQNGQSRRKP